MVASAVLNTLLLHCCGELDYPELALDIAEGLMRPVMLPMPADPAAAGGTVAGAS